MRRVRQPCSPTRSPPGADTGLRDGHGTCSLLALRTGHRRLLTPNEAPQGGRGAGCGAGSRVCAGSCSVGPEPLVSVCRCDRLRARG